MVTSMIRDQVMRYAVDNALAAVAGGTGIGVTVDNGIVTLSGAVTTIEAKFAAEDAVRRVKGVRAVANDLAVWPSGMSPSTELARTIAALLTRGGIDATGRVVIGVQDGWIDLTGEIADDERRTAAVRLIGRLPKVKGVIDEMALQPLPTADASPIGLAVAGRPGEQQGDLPAAD